MITKEALSMTIYDMLLGDEDISTMARAGGKVSINLKDGDIIKIDIQRMKGNDKQ